MNAKLKTGLSFLAIITVLIFIWFSFIDENKTWFLTDNFAQPILKNTLTDTSGTESISDFTEVVNELDTPDKLLAYMKKNFKSKYRDGHISYSPEEFFQIKKGGCKDLATFGSYVLDQHGYEVKIMCLGGKSKGQHAITLFQDKEKRLKYITNNAMNIELIEAGSIDDILLQEGKRLDCEITKYGFVPAGSTYVWIDYL